MLREMLRSKIHRATITGKSLDYEGSITIDAKLVRAARMLPNEKVQVLNLNNGNRFDTYIIEGEPGKGQIELNGAAARLGKPGDKVIILCYACLDEEELAAHKPTIVLVDNKNRITRS